MPGRTRRTVTEDQIEEAAAPTRGTQDSVADASDDERRPGPSRRAQRKDAGADGAESDAEEIIDVRGGLANAALARADAKNVGALSADWAQLAQLARTAAGDAMPEIGAALADVQGEAAAKALDELDGMMREMVDLDAAMRVHKDVLDGLFQAATRGDDVTDVKERWRAESRAQLAAYGAQTARQKYAGNTAYKAYRERVYETQNDGESMPRLKGLIPREDGDPDSDDEEIELGGATQNFTCPLTLQPLEDPLCSRVCPHAYSRAAILQYVGAGSGKKKCPASGCAHMLGRGDLQEDKAFERRVRDHTRREAEKKEKAAAAQSKDGALDIDDDDDE